MSKKTERVIPKMIVHIDGEGKADIESLSNNEVFSSAVFNEAFESIKDAIKTKSKTAVLFELGRSEYYIEIEEYNKCVEIRDLITKL
jgi:hypothetical protein